MFGGRGRNLWRNQSEPVLCSAGEGAIYGAINRSPCYVRRARAQPMAQPIGARCMFGGRGRNAWRNQQEPALCSAGEGATYGATNRSPFYVRRPRAQLLAQPIG